MPIETFKTAYCPACDRPYFGRSLVEAMAIMREHLKKCNPDMLDSTRD